MKPRPKPRPINYQRQLDQKLRYDPQVKAWTKRLLADPDAKTEDLGDEQLTFVVLELAKRRPGEFSGLDKDLFAKAMADTTPILAAPRLERTNLAEDLEAMFAQPELRGFWERWDGRRAEKGPKPDFLAGKALAMVMGMGGISPHADDAYADLKNGLWDLFEDLDGGGERELLSYPNALRQLPRLACPQAIVETNIDMIRALAELYPGQGVGERLMIDGMPVPAWCRQLPKGKTEEEEEQRRRHCPEAGARALMQEARGKRDVGPGEKGSVQKSLRNGKFWRGYYLVLIADQATGLPLVWTLVDANYDEAESIVPLLSDLYRYWPDCPAKLIAGDSAWDEDGWCRLCEVDYGIHPIFRLHAQNKKPDIAEHSRDRSVAGMTDTGRLICAAHRKPLPLKSVETGRRVVDGKRLRPGRSADPGDFRVRAECKDGCGGVGMRMLADWSRLTFYPHHASGKPARRRFAMRLAMLARLNGIEGIFNRLQGGKKLGSKDADRTRLRDKGAHETVISLALLSMTAASLTVERQERGLRPLPPDPGDGGADDGAGDVDEPEKATPGRTSRAPRHEDGRRRRAHARRRRQPQSPTPAAASPVAAAAPPAPAGDAFFQDLDVLVDV